MGIYNQGVGGVSGWRLLRGNIGLRGFWLTWPNRILTEDRPGDCTSYGDGGGGQTG